MLVSRSAVGSAGISAMVVGEIFTAFPAWINPSTLISVGLIVAFIFTPVFDKSVLNVLRRNTVVVKEFIGGLFEARLAEVDRLKVIAEANADGIEFIRASVLAQGQEIPRFSAVAERLTIAVEALTLTCAKIESDGTSTHETVVRLEERLQAMRDQREEDFKRLAQRGGRAKRASDDIDL